MRQPDGLWQQYQGKALAELARGMGRWPLQPHPCNLEPPLQAYDRRSLTAWDCWVNDWEGTWSEGWFGDGQLVHPAGVPLVLPYRPSSEEDALVPVVVQPFSEDEVTIPAAEQFLLSLAGLHHPISFEVIGFGWRPRATNGWIAPSITIQFIAHRFDAGQLRNQLQVHYPNAAVLAGTAGDGLRPVLLGGPNGSDKDPVAEVYGTTLALRHSHCWPIKTVSRLDPDPLAVAIGVMEHLGKSQWAVFQVLFQPACQSWATVAQEAASHPYKAGDYLFEDLSAKVLKDKFGRPLFAVAIRILASHRSVCRQLLGWTEQFAAPPQGLTPCVEDQVDKNLPWAVMARCTFRPGILLNSQELASMVHPPSASVLSERLARVKSRTRLAPAIPDKHGSVVLGENVHQGRARKVAIPSEIRSRHTYICGGSGVGKTTLLLNMALSDIMAGHGVGLLDPHGDLVKAILRRIPEERINDVVLFDAADTEYPFAMNILEAHDEAERERIVAETIMALERYFPASWGPRLERILQYTLRTVLHAIPGATLADVERMLTDSEYRENVLTKVADGRLLQFWTNQFRFLPRNACDPVLNKLSVFLLDRHVRNIVCQRQAAINFDRLLNEGKILLANLSTGLLTEKVAGTLGSFLVTKIVNAAFRRANLPEQYRRPWFLYVDEFQSFMNLSVGFERILAEARKYRLVLAGLANQYIGQLSPAVRQAIFGNVASCIVFRLGTEDAHAMAKELGVFTADDILNLELGQAIARIGASSTAFNLRTNKEPTVPPQDPTPRIVALARERYARPRREVEAELADVIEAAEKLELDANLAEEPSDPSEDDLVT